MLNVDEIDTWFAPRKMCTAWKRITNDLVAVLKFSKTVFFNLFEFAVRKPIFF
jgi:hypothetical protein